MLSVGLICVFLICELFLFTSGCDNGCIMVDTSCVDLSYICKQRIYSDVCNAACNNEAVPNNDLSCKYKGKDVNFIEYFNHFNGSNDPVICPKMIVPPLSPVNLIINSTNVKVSCITKTDKPVHYYKNGIKLQKEVYNGQLFFPKVDESIKGIYTCGVINDENRRSSDMFEIRVNTPPTLNLKMVPQSPKKDDNVTLYCNITAGIPVPNLTWKFNGKEVKQEERDSKYSVFRIASFQPSNSGIYECIGKNVAGNAIEQITIPEPKGMHGGYIALIVIVVLILIGIVIFVVLKYTNKKPQEYQQALQEETENLQDQCEKAMKNLEDQCKKEMESRQDQFKKMENLNDLFQKAMKKLRDIFKKELENLQDQCEKEMKKLHDQCEKAMENQKDQLEKEMENQKVQFEKEMKKLQDQCEKTMKNLQDQCEKTMKNLQDQCEKEMESRQDQFENKRRNLEEAIKYLQDQFEKAMEKLRDQFKKAMENLQDHFKIKIPINENINGADHQSK